MLCPSSNSVMIDKGSDVISPRRLMINPRLAEELFFSSSHRLQFDQILTIPETHFDLSLGHASDGRHDHSLEHNDLETNCSSCCSPVNRCSSGLLQHWSISPLGFPGSILVVVRDRWNKSVDLHRSISFQIFGIQISKLSYSNESPVIILITSVSFGPGASLMMINISLPVRVINWFMSGEWRRRALTSTNNPVREMFSN